MQPLFAKLVGTALLLTAAAYGQSLGDVARENREKKAAEESSTTPARVITNKDLPVDSAADQDAAEANSTTDDQANAPTADQRRAQLRAAHRSAQQRAAEERAANQWKLQIAAQQNRVAALQEHIDQIRAEMRAEYGTVQYEPPYSRPQAWQLRQISQLESRLGAERARLAELQESARRAGMHTPVYDP